MSGGPGRPGLLPRAGPLRWFALSNVVNMVGSGLYLTGSALYFTRVAGLRVDQVATGLAVATGTGLVCAVGLGRLADRCGPKPVYLALLLTQSLAMAAFTQVRGFGWFLVAVIPSGIADRGISGIVGALVHTIADEVDRVAARAQVRTSTNIGIGVGTLIAGFALASGSRTAYTALIAGNALLYLAAGALIIRLPGREPRPRGEPNRRPAAPVASPLRDLRYLTVGAANGLMSIYAPMLSFAMPLWVVGHTRAPAWSVSAILVVNTVLVILLQVRVSAGAQSAEGVRRYARFAGFAFAAGALVFAAAPGLPPIGAFCLALAWAGLTTVGELLQSSFYFYCSFELAPDEAQGAYQSVFFLGPGVMRAVGPALLTLLVLDRGAIGWVLLGAIFVASGFAVSAAVGWAAPGRIRRTVEVPN
jgi:MFS family permease